MRANNADASGGDNRRGLDGVEITFAAGFVAILCNVLHSKAKEGTSWGKLSVAALLALLFFFGSLVHTDLLAIVDVNSDGSLNRDELQSVGVFLGVGFLFLQFAFHVVIRGCYKHQMLKKVLIVSSSGGWRKKFSKAQVVNTLHIMGQLLGGAVVMIVVLYIIAPRFMDRDKDMDVDLMDVALLFDTNDDKNPQSSEIAAASFVLLGGCWEALLSIQAILIALMTARAQYVNDEERKQILESMDKAQNRWKELGKSCRDQLHQRLRDDWDDVAEAYRKYHSLLVQFDDIEFDPPPTNAYERFTPALSGSNRYAILKAIREGYTYATCVSAGANGIILRSKLYSYPFRKLLRFKKKLTVALKLTLGATAAQKAQLTHENTVLAALQMNTHPNSVTFFGNLSKSQTTMKFVTLNKDNVVQKIEADNALVMEYLEDGDLQAAIHKGSLSAHCGALTMTQKLNIIQGIAKGMAAVHECGYIHKDLKPANIGVSVDSKGQVVPKILDYGGGIHVGQDPYLKGVTGTPGYIAPEQPQTDTEYINLMCVKDFYEKNLSFNLKNPRFQSQLPSRAYSLEMGINGMRLDVFSFGIIANEILRSTGNDGKLKGRPMVDRVLKDLRESEGKLANQYWLCSVFFPEWIKSMKYNVSKERPLLFSKEHDPCLFNKLPHKEGLSKIQELIQCCWDTDKTCRPQFKDIVLALRSIVIEQNGSSAQKEETKKTQ